MSTIFDDRERAFEAKWARDADHRFRVLARRNRLLAEWAVADAELTGDEAEAEIRRLMKAEYEARGDRAFFEALAAFTNRDIARIEERADAMALQAGQELDA